MKSKAGAEWRCNLERSGRLERTAPPLAERHPGPLVGTERALGLRRGGARSRASQSLPRPLRAERARFRPPRTERDVFSSTGRSTGHFFIIFLPCHSLPSQWTLSAPRAVNCSSGAWNRKLSACVLFLFVVGPRGGRVDSSGVWGRHGGGEAAVTWARSPPSSRAWTSAGCASAAARRGRSRRGRPPLRPSPRPPSRGSRWPSACSPSMDTPTSLVRFLYFYSFFGRTGCFGAALIGPNLRKIKMLTVLGLVASGPNKRP